MYRQFHGRVQVHEVGVDGGQVVPAAAVHLQADDAVVRNDDRAHVEVVRRNGRNGKIAAVGRNHRAAAAQVVRRGTRGGGN